jgi:hypothetical protein
MSDAALMIWISCGSLLASAGSLVVSVAAYRRSGTSRQPHRLNELSRDIANLRPRLEQLERTIPKAVQSGALASGALGNGFRAGADAAAVRAPGGQLDGGTIPRAVQSGAPASAAPRQGLRAGADAAAVRAPGGQVDGGTIPGAVQSGAPASAAPGHGLRAGADAAAVRAPGGQLDGGTIPRAAQAGAPAPAAPGGHGLRAGANAAAVRVPRGQLEGAASIPKRVDYAGNETASLTGRQVSTRLEQLVHYMREKGRPK